MLKKLFFLYSFIFSGHILADIPKNSLEFAIKFSAEKCSYDPKFDLGCSQSKEEKVVRMDLSECIDYSQSRLCSGRWSSEIVRDDLFFGVTLYYYNQFDLEGNLLEETLYGTLQSGKEKDTSVSNFSLYLDGSKLSVPLRISGSTIKVIDESKNQTHLYRPQIYLAPIK